jgi:hypothetical protein
MESVSRLDTNQVITVMTDNVAEEAKKGKSGFFLEDKGWAIQDPKQVQ